MEDRKRLGGEAADWRRILGTGAGISRREFLKRGAGVGLTALVAPSVLAACGGGEDGGGGGAAGNDAQAGTGAASETSTSSGTIRYVDYGGAPHEAYVQAWYDPYMEANPDVKLVAAGVPDNAQLRAMVESGNVVWDLVEVTEDIGLESTADLLVPIDCNVVQCDALGQFGGTHRVGAGIYGAVVSWNTEALESDRTPQSWADVFDVDAFPGKRTFFEYAAGGVLEIALIADGATQETLYPLDLDRAFAKLDTIKSDIVWWQTGAQSAQLLADGEAPLGMVWNGRVSDIERQGAPVGFTWNECLLGVSYWVIPKGSPNVDEAMKFLGWLTQPENHARMSNYIEYSPASEAAFDDIAPDRTELVPPLEGSFYLDNEWWDENGAMATQRFEEWLQS